MRYGICKLSVVPLRKEKSHESELVSELLYNDIYEVQEECHEWIRIKNLYDEYEGWLRTLQHTEIKEEDFKEVLKKDKFIINTPCSIYGNTILSFGSKVFEKTKDSIALRKTFDSRIMVESAIKLLNTPYRWGGKSIMGIDCSAFVQLCAKVAGYKLPRDASQQIKYGNVIKNLSECQSGDLAFFENENQHITHVGILLSKEKIIHASGKVRIDSIDQKGIYNKDLGCYTHELYGIRTLIDKN